MKKLLLLLLIATEALPVLARIDKEQSDRDSTIYKNVNLNEIEVISAPKSETRFCEYRLSEKKNWNDSISCH